MSARRVIEAVPDEDDEELTLARLATERAARDRARQDMRCVQFDLPACWASYLIDGDASGLEPAELHAVDQFLADKVYPAGLVCTGVGADTWHGLSRDVHCLYGELAEYTFCEV
jgi:hypothetical protein